MGEGKSVKATHQTLLLLCISSMTLRYRDGLSFRRIVASVADVETDLEKGSSARGDFPRKRKVCRTEMGIIRYSSQGEVEGTTNPYTSEKEQKKGISGVFDVSFLLFELETVQLTSG